MSNESAVRALHSVFRATMPPAGVVPPPVPVPEAPAGPAPGEAVLGVWDYVTTARLLADTVGLVPRLPKDLDAVVGVARSGLLPASLLAATLHVPLYTVSRRTGLFDPGNGRRMEDEPGGAVGHALLVDDTAAYGREMRACAAFVAAAFPGAAVTKAVVYCHPQARRFVDLCAAIYDGQHFLEWNWPNAGHGQSCAYDFDGILCRDFTREECVDAATYLGVMASIEPRFLPRRRPVPLVVTARPEASRAVTLDWLARHRVRVERLVMRDWGDASAHPHDPMRVAAFKARHYRESACPLFAESEPAQAAAIARISGKPVLCPAAGRVFPGEPAGGVLPAAPYGPSRSQADLLAAVAACPDRGGVLPVPEQPACGCAELTECRAGKGAARPGAVTLQECLLCRAAPDA